MLIFRVRIVPQLREEAGYSNNGVDLRSLLKDNTWTIQLENQGYE